MAKISGENGDCLYGASATIDGATHDTGIVTVSTTSAHGYSVGDLVDITGVVGMTDLNAKYVIDAVDTTTSFDVELTTAQSYTSGGTVRRAHYITSWTVDRVAEVQNITDSGSAGTGEFQGNGHTAWSGTIAGFVEGEINTLTKATELYLRLVLESGEYYYGQAIVAGEVNSLNVAGTEAVRVEYTYQGTDTLMVPS